MSSTYYLKHPVRVGTRLVTELPIKPMTFEDLGRLTALRDEMSEPGVAVHEAALAGLRMATGGMSDLVLTRLKAEDVKGALEAYAGQAAVALRKVVRPKWQH